MCCGRLGQTASHCQDRHVNRRLTYLLPSADLARITGRWRGHFLDSFDLNGLVAAVPTWNNLSFFSGGVTFVQGTKKFKYCYQFEVPFSSEGVTEPQIAIPESKFVGRNLRTVMCQSNCPSFM